MAREMKDSGIEWLGSVPHEWEVRKVKHYYKLQTGFTPDTKKEEYYDDINGYDWVNISDIQSGKVITETKKKISKVYIDQFSPTQIPAGSLLYSFKLSVGQTAFAGKALYSNEAIAAFIPSEEIDLHFLRYSSFMIIENAEVNIYNARILNRERINNAYIVFPPLETQRKIASFLDSICFHIDTVIEQTRSSIEEYKKLKQAVITKAVTKGVQSDAVFVDSKYDWIGNYPSHWEIIKIKWLLNERNERSENGEEEPLSMSQKYGLIPTKEMDIVPNMAASFVGAKLCYKNDLVFNKLKAHLGVFAVSQYDGLVSPDYAVYYANSSVNLKFLEYLFKTPQYIGEFRKKSTGVGAGLTRLYTAGLYSIHCALPPLDEQASIVAYLNEKIKEMDTLIDKKEHLLSELENYKKTIIFEYVTGKKEVPA